MKKNDFYLGYEGEPEITIKQVNQTGELKYVINIWRGYFEQIIEQIPPGENGWEGITWQCHMHPGLYWNDFWEVDDLNLLLKQMNQIKTTDLFEGSQKVHLCMLELVKSAKEEGDKVWFEYC